MVGRRGLLVFSLVVGLLRPSMARAQLAPGASEAALRDVFSRFAAALVRRDVGSLSSLLTADAVWVFPDSVTKQSREDVAIYIATVLGTYDFKMELVRLKMSGREEAATVVIRAQLLLLPVKDGKYAMVFNRDPMLSRWRLENGEWRLHYVVSDVVKAAALVKAEGLE